MLLLSDHFCAHGRLNDPPWKMKHPSDSAEVGFEPKCYRYLANRATSSTGTSVSRPGLVSVPYYSILMENNKNEYRAINLWLIKEQKRK